MRHLDEYLLEFEAAVTAAGGTVHWARDGDECNRIVADLVAAHGVDEVVKVKSLTTEETELNEALARPRDPRLGDRPGPADHPARRRCAVARAGAGDPQEPRPRSASCSGRSCPARPPT